MATAELLPEKRIDTETPLPRPSESAAQPVLDKPATVLRRKIIWLNTIVFFCFHALMPLMFVPYFFSWYGLLSLPLANYIFCSLGIGAGYHRLLTHRGYQCPRWLEYTLATLGVCCMQDTPARWVTIHRIHHNNSDEQPDPHSPLVTLFWAHIGWLFVENTEFLKPSNMKKYSKELLLQPYYRWLESRFNFILVLFAQAALIAGLGALYGVIRYGDTRAIVQCAVQWLYWGAFMRVIYTWHVTWSVNSFAHVFGYRNYETLDNSRNNWVVGLATNGEGWHNNHHADPRSALHGHRWWELDLTYATIRLWEKCGLAWHIALPHHRAEPVTEATGGGGVTSSV